MSKTKSIGMDIRMVESTGIGTYIQGLLSGFLDHSFNERMTLFGAMGEKPEILKHFHQQEFKAPIYSVKEQWDYRQVLKSCHLWHATHYNIPLFKPKHVKLIATVHDLIHWIYRKEYFSSLQSGYAHFMFNAVVKNCDHIISVSEHTKSDLINHFNADPQKITVIGESVRELFKPLKKDLQQVKSELLYLNLPEEFFIFVGSMKPHKNLEWLMDIFEKLHAQNKLKQPLVIVGRADLKYPKITKRVIDLEKKGIVRHLQGISDKDLVLLYNLGKALIHPSLYEGFGLTLLEAMACGTPVITCPNASIPEVVGDAAWMVDSGSENAMMHAILKFSEDEQLTADYRSRGLAHIRKFSWTRTALETQKIYESVLVK